MTVSFQLVLSPDLLADIAVLACPQVPHTVATERVWPLECPGVAVFQRSLVSVAKKVWRETSLMLAHTLTVCMHNTFNVPCMAAEAWLVTV